ncbi:TolB family protein [Pseudoroseicyclus sp. CXY001]|uniref:TolB family protein n=1 Tax=Pseudoroseicyclus sp. CXY001 TaxID=3242492 RepID=UPI003570EFAB
MTSWLEIYDIGRGTAKTLLQTDMLIEAPNWAPGGQHLVVNGDGGLFRVPLRAPALAPVDTGIATKLNNDHGISPDGATLVVSSHAPGKSCIFTLPAAGGAAVRVTEAMPSWWHGWSPDGAMLAYTAVRDELFWICTCPATGGKEVRVTGGTGDHYDGPDYTPDGGWIWFNSNRAGSMDLWRVRPDGTGLEQMTRDERVNWFPHPRPKGGPEVLYLAYEAGVEGHPRDRDVELRLLNPETGEIRVLMELFGGQGSINVPCWSPDGQRFAFVRYG